MWNCPAPASSPSNGAPRACRGDPILPTAFFLTLTLLAAPPPPVPQTLPEPDPKAWWDDKWPSPPEAADPLGGRRAGRGERPLPVDNGVDPLMYRLWGLQPLQSQMVRPGEAVLEVWARPAQGVRQAVVRVTLRRDGKAFVQARAGLGCCEVGIGRRIAFDEPLEPDRAAAVKAVVADPMWDQPRYVTTVEADGTTLTLCVDGVSWDVTLATPGRSRHLRRLCLDEETGSIAPALQAALGAALGREPRFDVVFPRGGDFSSARRVYQDLIARGGRLRAAPNDRPQAPAAPAPLDEPAPEGQSSPREEPS